MRKIPNNLNQIQFLLEITAKQEINTSKTKKNFSAYSCYTEGVER